MVIFRAEREHDFHLKSPGADIMHESKYNWEYYHGLSQAGSRVQRQWMNWSGPGGGDHFNVIKVWWLEVKPGRPMSLLRGQSTRRDRKWPHQILLEEAGLGWREILMFPIRLLVRLLTFNFSKYFMRLHWGRICGYLHNRIYTLYRYKGYALSYSFISR